MDHNYEWHYLSPSPEEAQMGPVDLTTMTSLYLRGDIVSMTSFPALTKPKRALLHMRAPRLSQYKK